MLSPTRPRFRLAKCLPRPRALPLVAVVAGMASSLALGPAPGHGQKLRVPPELSAATPSSSLSPAELADSFFFTRRPRESLAVAEAELARDPGNAEVRWRAARAALSLGILEQDPEVELAWIQRAAAHGDTAVQADSASVDGLFWAAASKGRLALHHGPRTSSALAQEVWDLTHLLLTLQPDHGGGHNILGKLNQEVMSLSGFERFIGRLVLRSAPLREASWHKALDHHRQAVAAEPEAVLFHLDLGRTLQLTGETDEARRIYEAGIALPQLYPVDELFQERMRGYLDELGS